MPKSSSLRVRTHVWSQHARSTSWRRKLTRWPLGLAIFVAFLALYGFTLRPGILPADSGEYQRVVATAGVAHPPGYPLYAMVGWLFSQLPVGSTPALRVNAFSAVTAAATVVLVYSTARSFTDSVVGGIVAAVALGSSTTFWATGTKASIRPLTAFFTALCLYALARHTSNKRGTEWARGHHEPPIETRADREGSDWPLSLFFLSLSLGFTHHPSLAFPGFIFLLYLVLIDPVLLREPRRWIKPALAVLPGLLVLAYLPLRGGPELAKLSGFLEHVLARGFRGDMFALNLLDRLILFPTLMHFQFNLLLLGGMAAGALSLLVRDRRLAVLLLGSFVIHTAVTLTYDAPQTVEYEMPGYVVAALLLSVPFGRQWISTTASTQDPSRSFALRHVARVLLHLAGAVLLVAAFVNVAMHLPSYRTLSRSHDTRDYIADLIAGAPQDAAVLANWHWFTPLRYAQEIEGLRPDLDVEYVAPRGEPLAETWVRRIEDRISQRPVIVTGFFEQEYSALPYTFEPLGEAFLVRAEPCTALPPNMDALDTELSSRIRLLGYRRLTEDVRPAQPFVIELAWSSDEILASDVSVFVQLIGPDGRLWSAAEDARHPAVTVSAGETIVDRIVLYPYLHAPPGHYDLVAGAYDARGRLTTQEGADNLYLEAVPLQASRTRPVTGHRQFVRFAGGPALIGVDYEPSETGGVRTYLHWMGPGDPTHLTITGDNDALLTEASVPGLGRGEYATIAVDRPFPPSRMLALGENTAQRWNVLFRGAVSLPRRRAGDRYVPFGDAAVLARVGGPSAALEPGTEATVRLRFLAQLPLQRDFIVSTSLTGLETDGTWAWRTSHDTVPALGAIPTLKWIQGSVVLDTHRMRVPADAASVPVEGSLIIYDHFTQRILPNLDGRLAIAVPLGTWHTVQ